MKWAIVGSHGQLGSTFLDMLDPENVVAVPRIHAFTEGMAMSALTKLPWKPDILVNAAALSNVDLCELNEQLSYEANELLPYLLGHSCAELGIKYVHISTDFVFDGDAGRPYMEKDKRLPVNAYGRHKAGAEGSLDPFIENTLIVRTSKLFSSKGNNFMQQLMRAFKSGNIGRIPVIDDQFSNPTYVVDLVRAIEFLCSKDVTGICHVTNEGNASWYAIAKYLGESFSPTVWGSKVVPVPIRSLRLPAQRPIYSALNGDLLKSLGFSMRSWMDAAKECVKDSGWLSQI